ncbi:MAG: hypothetical protein GWN58_39265 [Anaerolineae bacterium]|nr:hypothetical protein [Anaerolineae bacterium]
MESLDRKQALVWGGLLILLGVMLAVEQFIGLSAWIWVAALAVAGLGAFGLYLTDRSQWGLLIPAYVLWAIAGLVALLTLNVLRDGAVATYVLTAIALPFLYVFLRDRAQWWALIPAYVLLAIGVMVGLIEGGILSDLLIPAYVMFAIAIPFFGVYARNTQYWWALIPGGIMAAMGLAFLIAEAAAQYVAPAVLVIAGVWILVRMFVRREPRA